MMRYWSSFSAVAFVVVTAGSPAFAQVTMQRKHIEGTSTSFERTFLLNQTLTIAGMEFKTTVDAGETRTVAAGKWNADGIIPLTTKTDSSRLVLTIPGGGQLTFDSSINAAKTDQPALEPYIDALRAIVGASYTVLVDRKEQVTGVEGVQAIVDRAPAKAAEALKQQLSTETIKREYQEAAEALPSKAVAPGDSWVQTVTLDLGAGQLMKVERRYEYKGTVERNGRQLDEIATTDQRIVSFEIAGSDEFPAKVASSELAPADDSKGMSYFDRELGDDVETQQRLHVKGKLTLTIQGMDLPSELDLTIDSQTKIKK
ncbi:MAG TPA: DUF6263 family protein [Pirellulales bacterium]|nr:DUF6263 family protein [Pirellulales bacterium]